MPIPPIFKFFCYNFNDPVNKEAIAFLVTYIEFLVGKILPLFHNIKMLLI
jgi:hypothetical protein